MQIVRAVLTTGIMTAALLWQPALAGKAQGSSDATSMLRQSVAAPRHLSYVGQMQNVRFGMSRAEATIFRVEHRAPDLTRRWYVAPQSLYGDSIITRGNVSYNLDIKRNVLVISKNDSANDQVTLNDNFSLLTANYRAIIGPAETIAGRRAFAILLMSKYTGQVAMRIWIDAQTKLVLQKETYASNGSVTHQSRFEHIRYTNEIPVAIFAAPKSGFQQVRGLNHGVASNDLERILRTAGFKARGPKYLPNGFVPAAGDVTDIKGIRTLHLLYSDGVRTLSLFENAKGAAVDLSHYKATNVHFEDHDGQYVEEGPTTLIAWEEAGLHFALVSDMSRQELLKIAASVIP